VAPPQTTRCSVLSISALPEFSPNLPECDWGEFSDAIRRQAITRTAHRSPNLNSSRIAKLASRA
jgi:hypothetical protein